MHGSYVCSSLCCVPAPLAVLLHLLFSTFLWMPSYYSKLWDKTDVAVVPTINGTKLDQFGMIKGGKLPTGLQVCRTQLNPSHLRQ